MIGQKFERLIVISEAESIKDTNGKKRRRWNCLCDCGKTKIIREQSLINGNTKSCGCLRKEKISENRSTHGMTGTRFYRIWRNIKGRCYDESDNQYHNYGAKGIKMSDEWLTFENFMNDMYDSYVKHSEIHTEYNTTIERYDTTKNYSKDNCCWKTQQEQARNRNDNISVEVNGVIYNTIKELAEAYNLSYQMVYERHRKGKRNEELIQQPSQTHKGTNHRGITVEVRGKQYESLQALHLDYPYISRVSLTKRYKQGKRDEELIALPRGMRESDLDKYNK